MLNIIPKCVITFFESCRLSQNNENLSVLSFLKIFDLFVGSCQTPPSVDNKRSNRSLVKR